MGRRSKTVRGSPAWTRRGVLAVVLLAVAFFPVPGAASGQATACHGCRTQSANAQRWVARLPGQWAAGDGVTGTVPVTGQAFVAVGGGVAAVGAGLTVTGFWLRNGQQLWQVTLPAPAGAAIISVRAWPGVVTAGITGPGGRTRTEVVIDSLTGSVSGRYPAAEFGGAVAASAATSVIIGRETVTSYHNGSGKVRWRVGIGAGQAWRTDGGTLYVAESAGGYLGPAPVTGLRVVDLDSGSERTLGPPPGHPFSGTMSVALDGVVLFTSATGVTAYSGSTGGMLWSRRGVVPEGTDPVANLVYLTAASGALIGVDPLTGAVKASVSGSTAAGSAGMYVVRGGVALGLDSGQGGEAWGYNLAAGRVTWTAPGLPWPHYFADLSGLGGSAAASADLVVVAACARLAAAPAVSPSPAAPTTAQATTAQATAAPAATIAPSAYIELHPFIEPRNGLLAAAPLKAIMSPALDPSPSVTASPSASQASPPPPPSQAHLCAVPELVALNI
jgi:putative pyrroloquinoline-quinone binding quinoprotein